MQKEIHKKSKSTLVHSFEFYTDKKIYTIRQHEATEEKELEKNEDS